MSDVAAQSRRHAEQVGVWVLEVICKVMVQHNVRRVWLVWSGLAYSATVTAAVREWIPGKISIRFGCEYLRPSTHALANSAHACGPRPPNTMLRYTKSANLHNTIVWA